MSGRVKVIEPIGPTVVNDLNWLCDFDVRILEGMADRALVMRQQKEISHRSCYDLQ